MKTVVMNCIIFVLVLGVCQFTAANEPKKEFELGNFFEAQYGYKVPTLPPEVPVTNFFNKGEQTEFDFEASSNKQYLVLKFRNSKSMPRKIVEFSLGVISGLVVHELGHIAEAKRHHCKIDVDIVRNTWSYEEACREDLESIAAAGLVTQKLFVETLLADGRLDSPFEWGVAVFDITNSIGYPIHDHLTGKGDLSYLDKDKKLILNVSLIGHTVFRVIPKLYKSIRSR